MITLKFAHIMITCRKQNKRKRIDDKLKGRVNIPTDHNHMNIYINLTSKF